MPKAKTLTERLGDIKGKGSESRESDFLSVYNVYSEPFNREKVEIYFEQIPSCVKWRDSGETGGKYTFFIEAVGSYFRPSTISSFIEIMDSIGEDLIVNCEDYVVERTRWFL